MASRVSALVVNFNAGAFLLQCVDSLRAGGVDEILVGDNDSTDGSLDALKRDDVVTVFEFNQNLGFGTAVNRLAKQATGDYLLITNPDVELDVTAVRELVEALEQSPEAMLAGAFVSNPDGTPQRAMRRRRPTPKRSLVTALGLEQRLEGVNIHTTVPQTPEILFGVSGALMLIRKTDWERLHGFDEAYFLHCEDLDLFARIEDDWQKLCVFVPTARAVHAHGGCHHGVRLRSAIHKWRGMRRYYWRHQAREVAYTIRWLWPFALTIRLALQAPVLWWRDRTNA